MENNQSKMKQKLELKKTTIIKLSASNNVCNGNKKLDNTNTTTVDDTLALVAYLTQ